MPLLRIGEGHDDENRPCQPRGTRKRRHPGTNSKKVDRSISRVLSWTVIHLGPASPQTSSNLPGSSAGHAIGSLFGLAPGGVYPATTVASGAVRSYRTFSPLPVPSKEKTGGIFSVALAVATPSPVWPPGVTWHPALWSPDFPPAATLEKNRRQRLSDRSGAESKQLIMNSE